MTDATVIPSTVTARISIRIVPDQSLEAISKSLQDYLRSEFAHIESSNSIDVRPRVRFTGRRADHRGLFLRSIPVARPCWDCLYIGHHLPDRRLVARQSGRLLVQVSRRCCARGMGRGSTAHSRRRGTCFAVPVSTVRTDLTTVYQSVPSIPYLEKEFNCHALHLPLGQSTVRSFSSFSIVSSTDTRFLCNKGSSASSERADFAVEPPARQVCCGTLLCQRSKEMHAGVIVSALPWSLPHAASDPNRT